MKKAIVVGGSNGIGLAIATCLAEEYNVVVVDKSEPDASIANRVTFEPLDLTSGDYSVFDRHQDASVVMITAGFGRLALFEDVEEPLIDIYFKVNTLPVMHIVKRYYSKLLHEEGFRLGVMVSISGYMSSPFFSLYAATKAALRMFIESVNVELEKSGSKNCILNVSPGSIKGTRFNGTAQTDLDATRPLAEEIVGHLLAGDDLFIPQWDEVFSHVLERYHKDFRAEGRHSYDYKVASGRVAQKPAD
ncbi:MAG: SDR family oxidoreductase [Prevotella sp.]|nr:SDR family oxidoreductase [Prevotella sp.]